MARFSIKLESRSGNCYPAGMFLFRIFFSLLALPFTLLRIVFGLFGVSTHILTRLLLLPLKIFARHTVLCIVLAAALILYIAIKKDPHAIDTMKPVPAAGKQARPTPNGTPPVIEPVGKRENGDSIFATDSYSLMSDQERAYYSGVFYKVMSNAPDGENRQWSYYNINGDLRPTRTFKNNVGVTCRNFSELLKVHHVEQTISGIACADSGGRWCKLKSNATPACGLGHSPGAFDGISNAVKNMF